MKDINAFFKFVGDHPFAIICLGIGFVIDNYIEDKRKRIKEEN